MMPLYLGASSLYMEPETTTPVTSTPVAPTPVVPPVSASLSKQKQASWGAIIIIVLILAMVVIGALYAWGQRVAETQTPTAQTTN